MINRFDICSLRIVSYEQLYKSNRKVNDHPNKDLHANV